MSTKTVKTETLRRWDDIHEYAKRRQWIWRGQTSPDWEIKTSIERFFERRSVVYARRKYIEGELLREFMRTYHQWAKHVPGPQLQIEWFSLMRHHGAPTRLVDFSYSVYVAAYFAAEDAEGDCAIWGVDSLWLADSCIKVLKRAKKSYPHNFKGNTSEKQELDASKAFFRGRPLPCALALNPFRMSERLRIQKGVFVIPGDVRCSFMDNLRALPTDELRDHSTKIVISERIREEALASLFYMNISRTSLFPGLDGYAQSLGVYHASLDPEAQFSGSKK